MTISRSIRKRLRRYALLCLLTATSAGIAETSTSLMAEDTHDSGDLCGWVEDLSQTTFSKAALANRNESAQPPAAPFLSVSVDDELAIDTCNYDTYLANLLTASQSNSQVADPSHEQAVQQPDVPHEPDAKQDTVAATKPSASRTSSQFNATLATIAAAASAGNPIPLTQWTEPFAMVGPDGSHTPKEIKAFQAWFDNSKAFVAGLGNGAFSEFVPVVDFDGQVAGKPVDSVAVGDHDADSPAPVADPLVGSSAVIATIEEAYQPYDLAAEDLPPSNEPAEIDAVADGDTPEGNNPEHHELVWTDGLFSPSLQPFCIHSLGYMREPGWSPLAKSAWPAAERVAALPADSVNIQPREDSNAEENTVANLGASEEQTQPPVQPKSILVKDAPLVPPPIEPIAAAEVAGKAEQSQPSAEPELIVAQEAPEVTPAVEQIAAEEVADKAEQPQPSAEPELIVALEAPEVTPAAEQIAAEEVADKAEQPQPPAEPELVVAEVAPVVPPPVELMVEDEVEDEVMVEEASGLVGSPDCLLEDLIWQVSVAMEDATVTDQWLRPNRVGKRLASLVVGGDRVASRVASELALVWPVNAGPAKPIPGIGAKLLARAEAAEQLPAEGQAKPFTPEQLARAGATLWQWVDVAQGVFDDLSDRLNDVTEVARNRGTQNDSKRR
ncbi:hypothetical protein Mal15_37980 [Stieleria maiorica]|uniref:Uncharacterized protein n=1 Tax=Stieleria maiorica TaxID=2795974 RepID=A0A5B9MEP3_9BACT|nr:hypothetical protein [Stieleria maiorica]QEF99732.1 hypothetical protein Mal15_37980 [Stieleria maiorica]